MTAPIGKRRFTATALAVVRSLEGSSWTERYMQKISEYTSTSLETVKQKLDSSDEGVQENKQLRGAFAVESKIDPAARIKIIYLRCTWSAQHHVNYWRNL